MRLQISGMGTRLVCLMAVSNLLCTCESYLHVKISKLALNHEINLRAKFFWSRVRVYITYGVLLHSWYLPTHTTMQWRTHHKHTMLSTPHPTNKPTTRILNYAADQTKNIFMLKYYHFQIQNFYIYFGSLSV